MIQIMLHEWKRFRQLPHALWRRGIHETYSINLLWDSMNWNLQKKGWGPKNVPKPPVSKAINENLVSEVPSIVSIWKEEIFALLLHHMCNDVLTYMTRTRSQTRPGIFTPTHFSKEINGNLATKVQGMISIWREDLLVLMELCRSFKYLPNWYAPLGRHWPTPNPQWILLKILPILSKPCELVTPIRAISVRSRYNWANNMLNWEGVDKSWSRGGKGQAKLMFSVSRDFPRDYTKASALINLIT